MPDNDIAQNLRQVRTQIELDALKAGRDPEEITLLAVSKRKSAETIRQAYAAGQRDFGENYLQEAEQKMLALEDLDLVWHFIGPIQSNKTRAIAENFDWVHSVDRIKIARRLSQQRPQHLPPLNICLQINIDDEQSKSGAGVDEAEELAQQISQMPNLCLRGLMCIPNKVESTTLNQDHAFVRLDQLYQQLKNKAGLQQLDTLSMGMSDDMQAAIAAGSTIVRIGTAIFGAR